MGVAENKAWSIFIICDGRGEQAAAWVPERSSQEAVLCRESVHRWVSSNRGPFFDGWGRQGSWLLNILSSGWNASRGWFAFCRLRKPGTAISELDEQYGLCWHGFRTVGRLSDVANEEAAGKVVVITFHLANTVRSWRPCICRERCQKRKQLLWGGSGKVSAPRYDSSRWRQCVCVACYASVLFMQIHERLVAGCVWDRHLKGVSWRVDVRTRARYLEQLNQPTGIVEMKLGPAESESVCTVQCINKLNK